MSEKKHRLNEQFINYRQMNELLAYIRGLYFPVFRKKKDDEFFKYYAFIEDLRTKFHVTLHLKGRNVTFTTRKDEKEVSQVISGVDSYCILRRYAEIHVIDGCEAIGSAVPLLWYNEKYNNTRQQAYAYDLNSAYSDAMNGPMPDTTKVVGEYRYVKHGEIGFMEIPLGSEDVPMPKNNLVMVEEGHYADIIFKAMESPFKRFVQVWYGRKKSAKTRTERLKAKQVLNFCVGYFQNKNPYLRATIITRCNNKIDKLIDDNTLYCNTDSLVSRVPRPDLKVGLGLGEWKLEHQGQFAYSGFNYQWDFDVPTYRGIEKSRFKKGWDMLKDPLPETHNLVEFNKEKLKLEVIKYGKEKEQE